MIALAPSIQIAVTLTGLTRGQIVFAQPTDSLMVTLLPFGKGDKGDKGDTGDAASLSADAGNELSLGTDGRLFYRGTTLDTQDW